jgi:hypothetical protein
MPALYPWVFLRSLEERAQEQRRMRFSCIPLQGSICMPALYPWVFLRSLEERAEEQRRERFSYIPLQGSNLYACFIPLGVP